MKAIFQNIILLVAVQLVALIAYPQVPVLNSYPSAAATIFLDFDGQYVTGTSWNWGGPIHAQAAEISVRGIEEIFNRVAEDYRPFNINVTTDSTVFASAPYNKRMRVIITSTSSWYGNAGGVGYVGSFPWGDDTPCWVFSSLLYNNTKWVAEAASHEAGHTLSLHHQSSYDAFCRKTAEYSSGQGEGEIGWAPIMGVGYYQNVTTWHKGPNTGGCHTVQSDIDIIASHTGYKPDDHANESSDATDVSILGSVFNVSGLINRSSDTDAFRIMIPIPTNFKLNAIPQNVGSGNEGANIDIMMTLLDHKKDTIGIYNPTTLLSAGIDTNLNSGFYYMIVKGIGNVNYSDYGSLGFYSLNGNLAILLPVHHFVLKGSTSQDGHLLTWGLVADEPIKSIVLESSTDGRQFTSLATLGSTARNFNYRPLSNNLYYRLKLTTATDDRVYFSNIISLGKGKSSPAKIISSLVKSEVLINSEGNINYSLLDGSGKLVSKGNLSPGLNRLPLQGIQNGILIVQFDNGNTRWSEKLVKY